MRVRSLEQILFDFPLCLPRTTLSKRITRQALTPTLSRGRGSEPAILKLESEKKFDINIKGQNISLAEEDVEILSEDIPGWQVTNEGKLTVALDTTISEKLREEGIAREFVNRVQNIRKDRGFEVTDKIGLKVLNKSEIRDSLVNNKDYICAEILATSFELVDSMQSSEAVTVEVSENISTLITIHKN